MFSSKILSALIAWSSSLRAHALTRDLHIVNAQISPDGFTRDAVLAEGTMPGPLLSANKGDEFKINVVNELTDNDGLLLSTSIHWHGLFQHGTNWADGPAFVNQCPIATNHSFLYDFKVPNQAGTFWYHSHLSVQYCDGLRGVIVIYDPLDPLQLLYDVDDASTIITLADWYHIPSLQVFAGGGATPDATLINGLGRNVNGSALPLTVINVIQGKRYRFRLVNIACYPNYNFTIDGHTMTIIEADGVATEPLTVDKIQIYAGQRYSFILNAKQSIDNYWIRANPDQGQSGFEGGLNSAILRYQGAPATDPTTDQTTSIDPLLEPNLHTLFGFDSVPGGAGPGQVDVAINLDVQLDLTTLLFTVNNVSFEPPTVPVLLQILSGAQSASSLMPLGSVYTLPLNKVIELSIPGGVVDGGHPVHLHGHKFWVIRSAGSTEYNYNNPVQRDVVNIGGAGDNVTIRWVTNNPGPWFFHCHIEWHLVLGFAVVFAEDPQDTLVQNPVPPAWSELCPIYDALPADQI